MRLKVKLLGSKDARINGTTESRENNLNCLHQITKDLMDLDETLKNYSNVQENIQILGFTDF